MKNILLFAALLCSSTLFSKDLTVLILEGWKSKPMPNCKVILKSNVGKFLQEVETDSLGTVVFTDLTYGVHTIEARPTGGEFTRNWITLKLEKNTEITLILAPTQLYEWAQLKLEDEKYGDYGDSKQQALDSTNSKEQIDLNEEQVTDTTEEFASYPGGEANMFRFIKTHAIYPEISRELGEQGRVYIEFIIEKDGVLTNIRVVRGLSKALDEEAKRLVRAMPNWTPSIINGKVTRTKCRVPITFLLE